MTECEKCMKLRRGNTALLEVVMDLVAQFGYFETGRVSGKLFHGGLSCFEDAFGLLEEAGMMAGGELLWRELEARKKEESKNV